MIEGHGDDAYKYKAIKINFSSNVYNHVDHSGLHQHLFQQMESIRTYPEPEPYSLEKVLAERFHLSSEEVCVTNGATEAIYLIAQTFRNQISAILMPTFSEYADACRLHGHKVVPIYNLNRLPDRGRLIWLCNPNNPTGEVREKEVLTACIKQNPQRIFVMDQSYEFFTQKALLTAREAAEFPNVILLHSMTKRFAVPGLRLGYTGADRRLARCGRLDRRAHPRRLRAGPERSLRRQGRVRRGKHRACPPDTGRRIAPHSGPQLRRRADGPERAGRSGDHPVYPLRHRPVRAVFPGAPRIPERALAHDAGARVEARRLSGGLPALRRADGAVLHEHDQRLRRAAAG